MRRLILPILLLLAVGGPIWAVFQPNLTSVTNWFKSQQQGTQFQNGSYQGTPNSNGPISVYSQASYANPAPNLNGAPTRTQRTQFQSAQPGIPTMSAPPISSFVAPPNFQMTPGVHGMPVTHGAPGAPVVSSEVFNSMGGQTITFPGNAFAPDTSAQPMEFVPTVNLAEIFRFDVFPNWVKNRWKRVSTSPGERGLHGLRVAVVTGTNTSDVHGSMTYFFDANQRCQRVTFRGWTGDSSKLIELLVKQYGFRAQPTHWAGLYMSQRQNVPTGALAMKHPTVISADNPAQQVALVLEMNNPEGQFPLSSSFSSIVSAASQPR